MTGVEPGLAASLQTDEITIRSSEASTTRPIEIAAVRRAVRRRRGALDEDLGHRPRAPRRREKAGVRVDLGGDDVRRHRKGLREVLGRDEAREVREDRDRGLRAREVQAAVVVVADPDDREKPRRVPDEPGVPAVVRRAGLAREDSRQAPRARAGARPAGRRRPAGSSSRGRWRPPAAPATSDGRLPVEHRAVAGHHADDGVRRDAHAAVRERGVRAGDLHRRDLEGAQGDRGVARAAGRSSPRPRRGEDVGQAGPQRDPDGRDVDRELERLPGRHRPAIVVVVVAGRPLLLFGLRSPTRRRSGSPEDASPASRAGRRRGARTPRDTRTA